MRLLRSSLLLSASVLLEFVRGQTYTSCNPLKVTCPADPALGLNHTFDFYNSTAIDLGFDVTIGSVEYGDNGAEFTVAKQGDGPTIQSKFYIFWGSVSVIMRAAAGQGIISSIVLQSDDLDEVDWEFMGGNVSFAETNYFGKGNNDSTTMPPRVAYYPVPTDVTTNFHNYTTHWTAEKLQWFIDGNLVRSLAFADAEGAGYYYPQTPMTVRMGSWAGGDSREPIGTIQWAGGLTDYSKGPFTMYVQSATVNDFSSGKEYQYSDHSGNWQSITTVAGNSTLKDAILAPPKETLAQKWHKLPSGTKLAVYCSAGAAAALLFSLALCGCVRQRRRGRRERDAYNAQVEREREEAYQEQIQLREKGLGGWNAKEYTTQGEDALGGWGGAHAAPETKTDEAVSSPILEPPAAVTAVAVDHYGRSATPLSRSNTPGGFDNYGSRANSPAVSRTNTGGFDQHGSQTNNPNHGISRTNTAGSGFDNYGSRMNSPGPSRMNTPGPRMMSPAPMAAPQPQRVWNGAPQGAMNPEITSYGSGRSNNNMGQSPTFPLASPQGMGRGPSRGGYQRF